ncbi:relaxase/mobilization nuclease, partial [Salmonella enterica subsp. enterica serovar Stanley]|nr:relaxase/mobilization nuclease [Salmonella enterica subsp. enterica serovar Stanley]
MAKNNDKDYRVRRAKGQNDRTAKLPLAHKLRNGGKDYAKKVQARINARGASREVMVKITGSSKTKRGIKNSINYITREGEITLRDNDGKEYHLNSNSERSDAYQYLSDPEDRLIYKDENAPNLVHNIVFSSPKIAGVSEKDALDSVEKILKEKYPD